MAGPQRYLEEQGIAIAQGRVVGTSCVNKFGATGGGRWKGYVEDVRITKGVARYTGNTLTVPTEAFPTS